MFFGTVGIVIAANTWLSSQGGKAIFSIALIVEGRPAIVFIGLIVVGFLLCLTAGLGWLYSFRFGSAWHERIPQTWLEGIETAAVESKFYQGGIFLVFIVFPLGALLHFVDVLGSSKICVLSEEAQPLLVSSTWWQGIPGATNQIRLVENLTPVTDAKGVIHNRCENGIQVYPPIEFFVVLFVDILAGILSFCFFFSLFHRGRSRRLV
jgi:hypothetical protein